MCRLQEHRLASTSTPRRDLRGAARVLGAAGTVVCSSVLPSLLVTYCWSMEIRYPLRDHPSTVAVLDVRGDGTVKSACLRAEGDKAASITATDMTRSVSWSSLLRDAKDRATLPDDLQQRVTAHMKSVAQATGGSTASRIRVRPDARRKAEAAAFMELVDEIRQYAESVGLSAPEMVSAAFSKGNVTTEYVSAAQWVREAPMAVAGLSLGRSQRGARTQ